MHLATILNVLVILEKNIKLLSAPLERYKILLIHIWNFFQENPYTALFMFPFLIPDNFIPVSSLISLSALLLWQETLRV